MTGVGGLSLTPTANYTDNLNAGTAAASYTYAGDANHLGSSDSVNFTIAKASSTTTVTIVGGPFTYTGSAITPATVRGDGCGWSEPDPDGELHGQPQRGYGRGQLHLRRRCQPLRQHRQRELYDRQGVVHDDSDHCRWSVHLYRLGASRRRRSR